MGCRVLWGDGGDIRIFLVEGIEGLSERSHRVYLIFLRGFWAGMLGPIAGLVVKLFPGKGDEVGGESRIGA